jgi:hypothetical protein
MGSWALWLGAISDTEYLERCGFLEAQKQFQQKDNSSNQPFTNILDKGYRSICLPGELVDYGSDMAKRPNKSCDFNL